MAERIPLFFDPATGLLEEADPVQDSVPQARCLADLHPTGSDLQPGDPVAWGSTPGQLVRGDAGGPAGIVGVALLAATAGSQALVVKRGVAPGTLAGGTAGGTVYLGTGGGLAFAPPSDAGAQQVRVGYAINATDLEVLIGP